MISAIALGRSLLQKALMLNSPSQFQPRSLSVVMSTADRPHDLRACLSLITTQQLTIPFEIIVVDNMPAARTTPPVVAEFPQVRLLTDARGGGISSGRNTGIQAAQGDVIVMTNDTTRPPQGWLQKLLDAIQVSNAACVLGNVLPTEPDHPIVKLVVEHTPLTHDMPYAEYTPAWFWAYRTRSPRTSTLPGGANIALRASVFADERVGLLNEAFGSGMPVPAAEDLLLYYRLLKAGYTIAFDPSVITYHEHVTDMTLFKRRVYGYAKGVSAYELEVLFGEKDLRAIGSLARLIPWDVLNVGKALARALATGDARGVEIEWIKVRGHLAGIPAWINGRRNAARLSAAS
jgi:O-antigen biosynthesis protein